VWNVCRVVSVWCLDVLSSACTLYVDACADCLHAIANAATPCHPPSPLHSNTVSARRAQLWRATTESDRGEDVRQCLQALERHVQMAYSVMQQRLLSRHLTLLGPLVQFTGVHISETGGAKAK
jgi:hypothetical protein